MTQLRTIKEVIRHLGGAPALAAMFGYRDRRAVHNWQLRGRIPPEHFASIQQELQRRGTTAPPELWGLDPETLMPKRKRA